MSLDRLLFAENAGDVYAAADMRSVLAGLASALGRVWFPAFGDSIGFAFGDDDLEVTAGGGGGLSVTVAVGAGVLATGTDAKSFHFVRASSSTVVTGFAAADPSLARVDLVCVHARDDALDVGGDNDAVFAIIEGTPGGGVPSDPGDQYWVLAQAEVPAGATSGSSIVITDRRIPFPLLQPISGGGKQFTPSGNIDVSTGGFVAFPSGLSVNVAVPSWAKRARCSAKLGQLVAVTSGLNHQVDLLLGSLHVDDVRLGWPVDQQGDVMLGPAYIDCTSIAGTTVPLQTLAEQVSGTGALRATALSSCCIEVAFYAV